MAAAPVTPQAGRRDDLVAASTAAFSRGCDIILGSTSFALAVASTWLFVFGRARAGVVIALWLYPIINLAWSTLARGRDQLRSDLVRSAVSMPLAAFIYVADPGVLRQLWLAPLMIVVASSMSFGLTTRRSLPGALVTVANVAAMGVAATIRYGAVDFEIMNEVVGVLITGLLFSVVASHLGRTLDVARRGRDSAEDLRQRAEATAEQLALRTDELEHTLDSLRNEAAQRARIEIELRQAQKLESVGRLAAGVAHEINTPLQFVSDHVQFATEAVRDLFGVVDKLGVVQRLVLEGAPAQAAAAEAREAQLAADLSYLTEHVPPALESAAIGLDRVKTIVRSMRDFAHPASKEIAAANLNRAIESTLQIACNEYKYVADLETDLAELPLVWCHIGELNQVVLNLIINAAHAIADVVDGTSARGRIRVRTYRDGEDAIIAIADTGTGIAAGIRERIFDPFFTTKGVGRGTGQGLALARSVVVDKHGGELRVETEPGKGSTFYIRIPIHGSGAANPARAVA